MLDPHSPIGTDIMATLAGMRAVDARPVMDLFKLDHYRLIVTSEGMLTGETYGGDTMPQIDIAGHEYALYTGAR